VSYSGFNPLIALALLAIILVGVACVWFVLDNR